MKKTQLALPGLFFLCFFLFVWRLIEMPLMYSVNGIFVKTYTIECTFGFFLQSVSAPGGFARYLASWLIHLFYWSWLGAAVLTALGLVLYLLSRRILGRYGITGRFIHFLPAVTLLLTYSFYAHDYALSVIRIAGLLACVVLYDRLPRSSRVADAAALTVLTWLAWYLFGWGWPLFAALAIVREFSRVLSRLSMFAVFTIVNGVVLFFLQRELWDVVAVFGPFEWSMQTALTLAGYLYFPLLLAAWRLLAPRVRAIASGIRQRRTHRKKGKRARSKSAPASTVWTFRVPAWLSAILFCASLYGSLLLAYNPSFKLLASSTHFARTGQWSQLLNACSGPLLQSSPPIATHYLTLALYHKGLLGSHLFRYPIRRSVSPLLMWNDLRNGYTSSIPISLEAFLALGAVNTAEKNAYETLEVVNLPFVLRILCLTNLAKGYPETARVFADNLAKAPFQKAEARRLQAACADSALAGQLPEVRHLRRFMERSDYQILLPNTEEELLLKLLESNPSNRMAFEYLLTHYLLTRQLDKFVAHLPRWTEYGYPKVPTHWQEALMVHLFNLRSADPVLDQIPIDDAVRNRFADFNQTYGRHRHNIDAVEAEMYRRFGNTYYFYYVFSTPE